MHAARIGFALALVAGPASPALAEDFARGWRSKSVGAEVEPPPPFLAPEFIDGEGRSRGHLTTALTLAEDRKVYTFDLHLALRVASGFAIAAQAPLGASAPSGDEPNTVFFGNPSAGFTGVGRVAFGDAPSDPTLWLGGGFDVYAPAIPGFGRDCTLAAACDAPTHVLLARPTDPGRYVRDAVPLRARGHAGFSVSMFHLGLDLGLTPVIPFRGGDSSPFVFLTIAAHARVLPIKWFEAGLEFAKSVLVAEPTRDRYPDGPGLLSIVVRGHFGGVDLGLFAGFPLGGSGSGPTFGLDLAGVLDSSPGRMEAGRETERFIDVD